MARPPLGLRPAEVPAAGSQGAGDPEPAPPPNVLSLAEIRSTIRKDFYSFLVRAFAELHGGRTFSPAWHAEVLAAKLEGVRDGDVKRLVVNVPPRHLKSLAASVALPAWLLGHDPGLAATSVGGVLTGRGADVILIDDPLKPIDAMSQSRRAAANDWFDSTLYSRLNDKEKGAIVIVMQRLHEDDLAGHVLGQGGWEVVSFPAVAEDDEAHAIETPRGPWTSGARPARRSIRRASRFLRSNAFARRSGR